MPEPALANRVVTGIYLHGMVAKSSGQQLCLSPAAAVAARCPLMSADRGGLYKPGKTWKKGNRRRKNDGQHRVCGLPFPVGLRLFVWKLISCPLSTFSWKKDYWVILLFNMFSFLKVSSPSEPLSGAVEVQILKAVRRCGRHCTISLSLACCCFPQVGRQLGILQPRESLSFRLCRRSLLSSCWSLGQCLPSSASSDVVLYLLIPLPNFSVMEVLCWPAWLYPGGLQGWSSTVSHLMPLHVLYSLLCMTLNCYQLCLLFCNHFKVHNQNNLQMLLF